MSKLQYILPELEQMKKYPDELNYIGNLELLKRKKVSIVGSRHPNQYTKIMKTLFKWHLYSKWWSNGCRCNRS